MTIECIVRPESLTEFSAVSGEVTPTLDNSVSLPAGYSYVLKTEATGSNTAYGVVVPRLSTGLITGNSNFEPGYVTFLYRCSALPASGEEVVLETTTSASVLRSRLTITSTGKFRIYDGGGNQIGSDSTTTFAANTWYVLQFRGGGASGAGNVYQLWYNAIVEIEGSSGTTYNDADHVRFGKSTDLNGNSMTQYYAGIIFELGGFSSNVHSAVIGILKPNANGSTMQWTDGTNSSDYQEVDDVPPDDTTYVQGTTADDVALFALENIATAGIGSSDTIMAVMAHTVVARVNSGADYAMRLRSGSTNSDTDTAASIGSGWISFARVFETDPATGVAWDASALDSIEVGGLDLDSTSRIRMTSAYVLVAYIPFVSDDEHILEIDDATHAHSVDTLGLTQTHALVVADATHAHSAENAVLGVSVTLVVADGTHAHAANNLDLTQDHALVVAGAVHGHAAEAFALAQEHLLAIADAAHAHTADNAVLGAGVSLEIADSAHAHAADNLDLAQDHALAVDGASHAHAADGLALAQTHQLAINDATHAHSAESCDATSATILAIADALHGHTADNLALAQSHVLAVADALHGHTADTLALGQAHVLVIADATHAHSAEASNLSQAAMLAIQDASHGHSADSLSLSQGHVLQIFGAVHEHFADSLSFAQAHVLVISSALHAHIADNIKSLQPPTGVAPAIEAVWVKATSETVYVIRKDDTIILVGK